MPRLSSFSRNLADPHFNQSNTQISPSSNILGLQSSSTTIFSNSTSSSNHNNSNNAPVEANIQVVVRCRPRNDREKRETAPPLLSFNGLRSRELVVKSLVSDKVFSRTFTFDRVFSPEAPQEVVYSDVVAPMLNEVIKGYNCTIFAYGQTGTGKTYTMEGSLEIVENHYHAEQAGVIPRVLFNLFETLFELGVECTVKLSCIELYNEELTDLLSPVEENAPKLKIFEDKKGVTVQNVEEYTCLSAVDALGLLLRANAKRKNAATVLNEHSSRSHAVYTLTVMTRETTESGEELIKTGKLNLVDLAGSENIGRSGAENKRAREAGMINQSLLTLGRVINALVEKSPHVPYRESKLTRLLQDSLGGRTKTCIIATVSMARSSMEETQSTLDYAYRAKNIRNKPEINQRRTKRELIAAYTNEIERLKADLKASREKNGIYLTEDRMNQLNEIATEQTALLEAARAESDSLVQQLANERSVHSKTRAALSDARAKNEALQAQCTENEIELTKAKAMLKREFMVCSTFDEWNAKLHVLLDGVVNVVEKAQVERTELKNTIAKLHEFMLDAKEAAGEYLAQVSQRMGDVQMHLRSGYRKQETAVSELEGFSKELLEFSERHAVECNRAALEYEREVTSKIAEVAKVCEYLDQGGAASRLEHEAAELRAQSQAYAEQVKFAWNEQGVTMRNEFQRNAERLKEFEASQLHLLSGHMEHASKEQKSRETRLTEIAQATQEFSSQLSNTVSVGLSDFDVLLQQKMQEAREGVEQVLAAQAAAVRAELERHMEAMDQHAANRLRMVAKEANEQGIGYAKSTADAATLLKIESEEQGRLSAERGAVMQRQLSKHGQYVSKLSSLHESHIGALQQLAEYQLEMGATSFAGEHASLLDQAAREERAKASEEAARARAACEPVVACAAQGRAEWIESGERVRGICARTTAATRASAAAALKFGEMATCEAERLTSEQLAASRQLCVNDVPNPLVIKVPQAPETEVSLAVPDASEVPKRFTRAELMRMVQITASSGSSSSGELEDQFGVSQHLAAYERSFNDTCDVTKGTIGSDEIHGDSDAPGISIAANVSLVK